jgi:hypothetical protein
MLDGLRETSHGATAFARLNKSFNFNYLHKFGKNITKPSQ